jgi:O-6-methylguanine DNA methyltransferase
MQTRFSIFQTPLGPRGIGWADQGIAEPTHEVNEAISRIGALLAREVGQALARNPHLIVVPCHRVLAAGGKLGGFSAAGGVVTKRRLLEIERADVSWQLRFDA